MVDIVMYHYVRPIEGSLYPGIKGLEYNLFKCQLEYFLKNNVIVSTKDVVDAINSFKELPDNSVWLTFDDGYKDHINYVAPLLEFYGVDAAFFPVSCCFAKHQALEVNKIHYILAVSECSSELVNTLREKMFAVGYNWGEWNKFLANVDTRSRFDDENTVFFKRMLQRYLPPAIREEIVNDLFADIVGIAEKQFCSELYLSENDIIDLYNRGFTIGSHSSSHPWLNEISEIEQEKEITESVEAITNICGAPNNWIMCYPFGAWNDQTIEILRKNNFVLGLTTKVASANLSVHDRFKLPRLDCMDFYPMR